MFADFKAAKWQFKLASVMVNGGVAACIALLALAMFTVAGG
jgi:thiol:disulfide interchange protein